MEAPTEVVAAASLGRVDTLWIARDEQIWGRASNNGLTVQLHQSQEPGDVDLLDVAAMRTLQNSGRVYNEDAAEIPNQAKVAAILRY